MHSSSGRGMVKTTYAHKKGRATRNIPSSPLRDIASDSPSMLKRAKESFGDNPHRTSSAQEPFSKRLKRASGTCDLEVTSDTLSFHSFDETDVSAFQTPHPLTNVVDSPAVQPGLPEQMSPVPVARRILSRTSSRNLKENSRRPRNLASPFTSRPGSITTSPADKQHQKRPLPMSRTRSEQKEQINSQNPLLRSVNPQYKKTPEGLRLSLRDRRPSVPNSSFLMQEMARQDWLVPPKALSRFPVRDVDHYALDSSPEFARDHSFFFGDLPLAISTPCHKRTATLGPMYAPFNGYCSPELSACGSPVTFQGNTDDIFMTDGTLPQTPDQGLSPNSCSVISNTVSSCKESSALESRTAKEPQLVSLRPYAFPSALSSGPSVDGEDSIFSPLRSTEYSLPPLSSSPGPVTQHDPVISRDVVIAIRPSSPCAVSGPLTHVLPAEDGLQNMFVDLALDECDRGVNSDEDAPHDSGIALKDSLSRSRSLDSTGDLMNKKKNEKRRTRDRRGTIRASDFAKGKIVSGTTNDTREASNDSQAPITRRTRSGTIIGPAKSSSSTKVVPSRVVRAVRGKKPASGPKSDQLAEVSGEESEDELLLKGHWRDGLALPIANRSTDVPESSIANDIINSDDDLLLLKAAPGF